MSTSNSEDSQSLSSEDNFGEVDHDILSLPIEFAYLQKQVERCRRYVQKKRYECVKGPGDTLHMPEPIPDGKTFTWVLDMDETLLLTSTNTSIRPIWAPDKVTYWLNKGGKEVLLEVWYRPGLMKFLAAVSKNYEIVIFSAGGRTYVNRVLDLVDPERTYISHVVFTADDASFYTPLLHRSEEEPHVGMQIEEEAIDLENQVKIKLKKVTGLFSGPYPRRPMGCVCGR